MLYVLEHYKSKKNHSSSEEEMGSMVFWNIWKEEKADVKCKKFFCQSRSWAKELRFHQWHQITRLSDDRLPQLTQRSRIKYSRLLHPHILILTSTYRQVIYLPRCLSRAKHWIGRVKRLNNHVSSSYLVCSSELKRRTADVKGLNTSRDWRSKVFVLSPSACSPEAVMRPQGRCWGLFM